MNHFGEFADTVSNVVLPHTFNIDGDVSIEANWWTILIRSGSNIGDTVLFVSRLFPFFIDAPIEQITADSLVVELTMEGVQ